MWKNSLVAQSLRIKLPLIQAPMAGGATTAALVASVSNAGALGSLGAGYMQPNDIRDSIQQIRKLTSKPFAVNLFVPETATASNKQIIKMQDIINLVAGSDLKINHTAIQAPYTPSFDEQIQVIIEEQVPIFSFTFGIPNITHLSALKKNNTILIGTATNLIEAQQLQENHIDLIVAQGKEAGGHRGTFIKSSLDEGLIDLNSLVQQLSNINLPIIASGGIMNAKRVTELFKIGASAVQLGTAFLTTLESGIHPKYKESLLKLTDDKTVLTRSFSGKLARGITNTFIKRMEAYQDQILDYPIQNTLTQNMRKQAAINNNPEFLSMWAGQSAYLCKSISATDLINELDQQVQILLNSKE